MDDRRDVTIGTNEWSQITDILFPTNCRGIHTREISRTKEVNDEGKGGTEVMKVKGG